MKDNRQILEALKARAKESREKAIAEGKATPRPQMPNKMAEILKKMREAKNNKI